MKKIKVLLLTLVAFLALSAFACKQPTETKEPTKEPTHQTEVPSEPTKEPTPKTYDVASALNYIKNMYRANDGKPTPSDYTVISVVVVKEDEYTIEWTVNVTSGNADDVKVVAGEKETTIDINEKASEAGEYDLTAKVIAPDSTSAEITFKHSYPKYNLMTWAEYMAAEEDAAVDICGVLVGAIKASDTAVNLYLEDEDGGYYVYAMPLNGAKVEDFVIGATYEVVGKKDDYYGTAELVSATATKLDVEVANVEPIDVTEKWLAATAATDPVLANLLGMYVTITNVAMKDISTDRKYINFMREDGLTSYVYISTSSNFVTADEITALYDKCIAGRTATITGLGYLYNGAFYVIPMTVDAIALDALPEKAPQEKLDDAKVAVNALNDKVYKTDLELPKPEYEDVTFEWTSSNTDILGNDGKIVNYPLEETEVELSCKITVAILLTDTVTVKVKVAALAPTDIAKLDWFNEEEIYVIQGKVIGADKYTDFYVADATGVCYVYTKLPDGIKVGDSVKVVGTTTVYGISKGQVTKEFMPTSVTKLDDSITILEPVLVDLTEAATLIYEGDIDDEGAKACASRFQGGLYEFYGYVKEVVSGSYTNYYLCATADGTGAKLIYNYTNSEADINAFAALKDKLVKVIAPVHDYSKSYGGWRIAPAVELEAVDAAREIEESPNTCAELYTMEKGAEASVTGTVIYVYSGNGFLLADETGAIYVFDKKAPVFHQGDIVKVSGVKDAYNGIAEIVAPAEGSVRYTLEKIQPLYKYEATEITFEDFLKLTDAAANFGVGYKMSATLVKGSYINVKVDETTTTNLYLSNDDKAVVGALFPDGATELTLTGVFYTYQFKNGVFMVFLDVNTIELD